MWFSIYQKDRQRARAVKTLCATCRFVCTLQPGELNARVILWLVPFRPPVLRTGLIGAMLNFEIAEHPVYDSLELQWYDDATRGTGMLALLNRRDTHLVDYYWQRGLRLDPADYQIGAGTGVWTETDFTDAFLEICDD